ncbi:MAG: hypothetical protein EXR99_14110 [Gemmataceae bacterium]|nr:hypothetical protein [Gemmataceae bacterium]
MDLFISGIVLVLTAPAILALVLTCTYFFIVHRYIHFVVRIFTEKPLFIVPRGELHGAAEKVEILTTGGLRLKGCYLKTPLARKGVILFGLEFGANRWSCVPYCEWLQEAGYDIFAIETRNQGESDCQPDYEPLQWITQIEVEDMKSAVAYLKSRPDADPKGIGFYGISKGAAAGLYSTAQDPWVRCCVTDGVFAAYTTMVPFMRQWISIYSKKTWLHVIMPWWFYGLIGLNAIRRTERERPGAHFLHLETKLKKMRKPWLMIHGEKDNYIKPDMARSLFRLAPGPKWMWLVPGAKHNQALPLAGDEFRSRVLGFFDTHLRPTSQEPAPDKSLTASAT